MTRPTRLCWTAAALLWVSGCGAMSPSTTAIGLDSLSSCSGLCRVCYKPKPFASTPTCGREGIVFVLDGAGGFGVASQTIGKTIVDEKMPLEVRTFQWTHGYCRVLSDQIHAAHLRREALKLAELVLMYRREHPDQPIYLLAHSAGCGVALIAAEALPPNTLERIVLLAPAVSCKRDLRGALCSSCQGIDVFISKHDWCCLGVGTMLMGTTDRCWLTAAAGKVGFQPPCADAGDEALYVKLRQYPWDPSLGWTGNKGGHYGSYQPGFLRLLVLPLLQESEPQP